MDRLSPHRSTASINGPQLQGDDAITANQDWAHATFSAARGAIEIRLEKSRMILRVLHRRTGLCSERIGFAVSALCCALGGRGRRFRSITPLE